MIDGIHSYICELSVLQFGDFANGVVHEMRLPSSLEESFLNRTLIGAKHANGQSGSGYTVSIHANLLLAAHASREDEATRPRVSEVVAGSADVTRFHSVIHGIVLGGGVAKTKLIGISVASFYACISELGEYFPPH